MPVPQKEPLTLELLQDQLDNLRVNIENNYVVKNDYPSDRGFVYDAYGRIKEINAVAINVDTLSAISANMGTITAGTITGATFRTAASGARVVFDSNGIKVYDASAQRGAINNDGSGWFGSAIGLAWTTTGALTAAALTLQDGSIIGSTGVLDNEFRANCDFFNKTFRGHKNDGFTEAGTSVVRGILDTYLQDARIYSGQLNYAETWDMDLQFVCVMKLGVVTNQDVFIGLIDQGVTTTPVNSTLTNRHIGFMIQDGTLYASVANGTTQTKSSAIAGYTLTNDNAFRILWDNGTNAKFYVKARTDAGYTLVATLATNLPSGSTGATCPQMYMGVVQDGSGAREMIISNYYLIDAI